jgi:hypothetical protein
MAMQGPTLIESDIPAVIVPGAVTLVRSALAATAVPASRHSSCSERGGWQLLGRLILWATRNNAAAMADAGRPAKGVKPSKSGKAPLGTDPSN